MFWVPAKWNEKLTGWSNGGAFAVYSDLSVNLDASSFFKRLVNLVFWHEDHHDSHVLTIFPRLVVKGLLSSESLVHSRTLCLLSLLLMLGKKGSLACASI
jgi:hypothetical protein